MTDVEQPQPFEPNFYERLFMRAYDFELTKEWDEAKGETEATVPVTSKRIVKDADIDTAYRTLIEYRRAIVICAAQFDLLGREHRNAAEGMQSLVERQKSTNEAERYEGIVKSLGAIIGPEPDLRSIWYDIKGAPRDRNVRLLGRRLNGVKYIETGYWVPENGCWSVELAPTYQKPTHWTVLEERLPEGY